MYNIPDDDTSLIRYLPYNYFLDLITNKHLFMNAPQNFSQDCNEGLLYKDIATFIDNSLKNAYEQIIKHPKFKHMKFSGLKFSGNFSRDFKIIKRRWRDIYNHNKKRFYISCWAENDIDQDSMWIRYIAEKERTSAVAIKTSVKRLKDSLLLPSNHGVYTLARIEYVDIDNLPHRTKEELSKIVTGVWATNCFLLTRKLKNFEMDKEVRLMTDNLMCNRTNWYKNGINMLLGVEKFDYYADPTLTHLYSSINPEILIEKVILSPYADETLYPKVKDLLKENNLEKIPIVYSQINQKLEDA